jgi:uncharacterized protein with GYD domain
LNTLRNSKLLKGVSLCDVYFTFGRYDGVVIFEAPGVEMVMSFVREVGFDTKCTTETLTAVPR